jgi:hypothetical protein
MLALHLHFYTHGLACSSSGWGGAPRSCCACLHEQGTCAVHQRVCGCRSLVSGGCGCHQTTGSGSAARKPGGAMPESPDAGEIGLDPSRAGPNSWYAGAPPVSGRPAAAAGCATGERANSEKPPMAWPRSNAPSGRAGCSCGDKPRVSTGAPQGGMHAPRKAERCKTGRIYVWKDGCLHTLYSRFVALSCCHKCQRRCNSEKAAAAWAA